MKLKTIFVGLILSLLLLVLPAAASGYTLNIFGNANEDDIINMQDVTYTELIILEYKDQTQFADAKYDGQTDILDVTQIELIILGKEKELTVLDRANRIVTINMPVERIASSSAVQDIRTICALEAQDRIVGVPDAISGNGPDGYGLDSYPVISIAHPELADLPIAGSPYYGAPNLEVISSLNPDLILVSYADGDSVQEATGVPTIEIDTSETLDFRWFRFMGYVLNKQDRAEELISYLEDRLDEIQEVTSDIPDDEKPKVYLAFWGQLTWTPTQYSPVEVAGGDYVADRGSEGPYGSRMMVVLKEQVIDWNPDIMLLHCDLWLFELTKEDILSDPDLQSLSAVQNEQVYSTKGYSWGWDPATGVVESMYMAKLFHPEKFADLDVETIGNEVLNEAYGVDGIWTEMIDMCGICTCE